MGDTAAGRSVAGRPWPLEVAAPHAPTAVPPIATDHDCRDHWELLAVARGSPPFEGEYAIRQCGVCGVGFTDPVPPEATAAGLYSSRASQDFQAGDGSFVAALKRWAARRDARAFVAGVRGPATIIDYGCGNGAFVTAIAEVRREATVIGADLHDAPPAALPRERYASYRDLEQWRGRADLILLRHVLEHTYDPVAILVRLRELLRPGGAIVIEVPSLESAIRSVWGSSWSGYYVPFHTLHFGPASLGRVVQAAGLSVARMSGAEIPMMGRSLQQRLRADYSFPLFALGVALHPVQLAVGAITRRPTCVRLWATHVNGSND